MLTSVPKVDKDTYGTLMLWEDRGSLLSPLREPELDP